jgi:hypothetical protein
LRKTDHVTNNNELVAILRRFDMDGDAKINYKEFEIGMKSNLTIFGPAKKYKSINSNIVRPKSDNL